MCGVLLLHVYYMYITEGFILKKTGKLLFFVYHCIYDSQYFLYQLLLILKSTQIFNYFIFCSCYLDNGPIETLWLTVVYQNSLHGDKGLGWNTCTMYLDYEEISLVRTAILLETREQTTKNRFCLNETRNRRTLKVTVWNSNCSFSQILSKVKLKKK